MSDFDREAEREKLREKYERDKQKREASERMSELLLQGATMTDRHCPECRSPVFRHDGRQFCPTCEKEVTTADGEADSVDAATAGEPDEPSAAVETGTGTERSPDTTSESPASEKEAVTSEATTDRATPEANRGERTGEPRASAKSEAANDRTRDPERRPAPTGERRPARVQPPATTAGDGTDGDDDRRRTGRPTEAGFNDAEASLRREIGSLTRQAEETRDIGRKRDLLEAAREAAETLQAIRRL